MVGTRFTFQVFFITMAKHKLPVTAPTVAFINIGSNNITDYDKFEKQNKINADSRVNQGWLEVGLRFAFQVFFITRDLA